MSKFKMCKTCGYEMAKSAKHCPKCGQKNRHPIRWLVFLIIVAAFIVYCAICFHHSAKVLENETFTIITEEDDVYTPEVSGQMEITPTYNSYTINQLFKDLDDNAIAASRKHLNEYVLVSGYLGTIDSDEYYFCIESSPNNNQYYLESIQCNFTSKEQKDILANKFVGEPIVIKGQIVQIDDFWGYEINIEEIAR